VGLKNENNQIRQKGTRREIGAMNLEERKLVEY
jgi:hypothetical protein